MEKEQIKNLVNELISIDLIDSGQIPDIDLYIDQVTTFIDDRLKQFNRNEDDKVLTKTMINNYTKEKLLPPPIKKKYTKSHILSLIMIYHLKSVLSITDINKILSNIPENDTKNIYDIFTKMQQKENLEFINLIDTQLNNISNENSDEKYGYITIILNLIIQANIRKNLAERLIDNFLK